MIYQTLFMNLRICWPIFIAVSCLANLLVGSDSAMSNMADYLESLQAYKCVSYRSEMRQKPQPGLVSPVIDGLQVRRKCHVMFDFQTRDYRIRKHEIGPYERSGVDAVFESESSYVGDEYRYYLDDNCSAVKLRQTSAGYGVIDKLTDRVHWTPIERIFGINVTSGSAAIVVDLPEVLSRLPVEIEDGGLLIKDVLREGAYSSAETRLWVKLDTEHGFLPSHIKIWDYDRQTNQYLKGGVNHEFIVKRFFRESTTGLWFPSQVEFRRNGELSTLTVVDESSVQINNCPLTSAYQIEFPKDKLYVNNLTRQLLKNGVLVEELGPIQEPFAGFGLSTKFPWIVFTVSLVLALIFLIWKKSRGALFFLWLFCTASFHAGCSKEGSFPQEPGISQFSDRHDPEVSILPEIIKDENQKALLSLENGSRLALKARVQSTISQKTFRFPIKNSSDQVCEFSPHVRATCGCVDAYLTSEILQPSEEMFLEGNLSVPTTPLNRSIQLIVELRKPFVRELYFQIDASYIGDWTLSHDSLCIQGPIGFPASSEITVYGKPECLKSLKWDTTENLAVKEHETGIASSRRLLVTYVPETPSGPIIIGKLKFLILSGSPSEREVVVSAIGQTESKWEPAIVKMKDEGSVSCKLVLGSNEYIKSLSAERPVSIESTVVHASGGEVSYSSRLQNYPTSQRLTQLQATICAGRHDYLLPLKVVR